MPTPTEVLEAARELTAAAVQVKAERDEAVTLVRSFLASYPFLPREVQHNLSDLKAGCASFLSRIGESR